ncbi:MAG: hypothetical protein ACOY45_05545 [Pseudomonadota bacterium]
MADPVRAVAHERAIGVDRFSSIGSASPNSHSAGRAAEAAAEAISRTTWTTTFRSDAGAFARDTGIFWRLYRLQMELGSTPQVLDDPKVTVFANYTVASFLGGAA